MCRLTNDIIVLGYELRFCRQCHEIFLLTVIAKLSMINFFTKEVFESLHIRRIEEEGEKKKLVGESKRRELEGMKGVAASRNGMMFRT